MTDETPEQKLRARVMSAWPNIAKWDAAMDLYGRERYLAGKVEGLAVVMRQQQQAFKHVEGCTCHGCNSLRYNIDKAEAEYAACVAALQEVKHAG